MKIKVGSLFDGIGGAPLSAVLSGAEPVWASEIEKVPISITKRHFPNMRHYGDITQINGAEIEPVEIITAGSPCQDLSVAGKRAGLAGERSGLFMEQVRIIKEMREHDKTDGRTGKSIRPRYMVWENVPGAFSSNKGEDFRAVLEEICKVCDPEVSIPRPPKGKWVQGSGTILGDGYSVAWRVVDAQYWGVPQRRRRIYLVADFGGQSAPEILFERESLPGDITESGETGQRIATDAERGSGSSGECELICSATQQANAERYWNLCPTITASAGMAGNMGPWIAKTYGSEPGIQCLRAEGENRPSRPSNIIVSGFSYKASSHAGTIGIEQEKAPTLLGARHDAAIYYQHNPACNQGGIAVVQSLYENHPADSRVTGPHEVCPTVTRRWGTGGNNVPLVMATDLVVEPVYSLDRACFNQGINAKYGMSIEENTAQTLVARGPSAVASPEQKYIMRRLTPLECERLQGFPDGWTALDHEDKPVSDSQRYKALGNSFAIPNAFFVISRCVKQLQKEQVNERD